jgi:cytoskeletal protein CcmA (bactofilin family)
MESPTPPAEGRRPERPANYTNGNGRPTGPDEMIGAEELMSVIGNGIVVTGNIQADVDLHIEGRVEGDVHCSTLILGERGSVTGNVFAERVRVSGTVEGGVQTTDLAIESTARVRGDVTYSRLRIANGGIIAGSMTHRPLAEDHDAGAGLDEDESAAPARVHYIE